jgi:NitT/TauT family transport system substrate-binding protein
MLKTRIKLLIICALLFSFPVKAENLRFGILPVIDTLPLQVAVKEGYFKNENLDVELIPFNSAMERNTAVHTGQLDGFFGDMIATLLLIEKKVPIRILTVSYSTNPQQTMFGLVTSPKLKSPKPGDSLTIAISKATIIEYLLTYIQDLPNASGYTYQPVEIKQMPIRLQMLLAGKIDSALLPEPLVSLAVSKGAKLLATDQSLDMPLTILNIAENKLAQADAFLRAYKKSVVAINEDPEKYRALMAKTCRIPKPMVKSFPMYRYPLPRLPEEKEVSQVQSWMLEKNLLKKSIPYSRLIP